MHRVTRNIFIQLLLATVVMGAARLCHATDVAYTGTFVGTEGLASTGSNGSAVAKNYTRDYNTTGDRLSIQVVASTYSVAVSTTFNSRNYTVNTPTITISGFATGWTTGLAVLYSTGSVAISGLTNQTTYYISMLSGGGTSGSTNPSVFKLSSSLANAAAGTGIVLASSSTATNLYTLAPVAWANTPTTYAGVQPQWSDDNANWTNATTGNWAASISSVTFSSSGNNSLWDFGPIQHRYLRMKVTPPTTGAMVYTITANEKYSVTH